MNKFYTILVALFITASSFAQAPEQMSYQALIRDSSGDLVISQQVGMQISVLQGSTSGTAVYKETHTPTTNVNGLVSMQIGTGTVVSGVFANIDWSTGTYYVKSETDPNGATTYSITGTSQLLSVPYALYATTSGSATNGDFVDLTTNQTIAGTKTFSSDAIINSINIGRGGGNNNTNSAIGLQALAANTSGEFNTATGVQALNMLNTGSRNSAYGYRALANHLGNSSSAFGAQALLENTTGNYNTAVGNEALKSNTTASNNTAVGQQSLSSNITGAGNTALGRLALKNNLNNNNTAVGLSALVTNTTGYENTALGSQADVTAPNITNATAIGYKAKVTNTNTIQLGNTSVTNVKTSGKLTTGAITLPNTDGTSGQVLATNGAGILAWSTPSTEATSYSGILPLANGGTGSATQNFVDLTTNQTIAGTKTFSSDAKINGINIGIGGGNSNTNSAIGLQALAANTSGQFNTATGSQALFRVSTGNSNSAYGYRALANNLGSGSSAFGMKALEDNTTGNYNIAVGEWALVSNTTADNNTAVGYRSLWSNITGEGNTALGRLALGNNLNNNNTAVGLSALVTNTTGYANTALGSQADVTVANITNATAIGFNAKVTNSNTIQLGNTDVTDVKTSGKLTMGTVTYPNIHNATAGQVLTTNASGVATWANLAPATSYSGILPVANGGTGSATQNFVDLTTAQTIAGTKTFNSDIMISTLTIGKGSGGDYTSVAMGTDALDVNTTGTRNTAIGGYALLNTTGTNNTATGYYALEANTTGSNNTSIGSFSGPGAAFPALENSTAIGFEARVTNSNTIQLGNAAVTEVRTSGLVKGKAFHATGPNYTSLEGGYLVWNLLQPGSSTFRDGYTSFVNNKGTSAGGFRFYNTSSTVDPSITPIVEINASGAVTANGFVKSGGTATQFLMADGSVSTGAAAVREVADEFTATTSQTSFTLAQTPSTNSKVKMYVNGIRVSNAAYTWSGSALTYIAANNGNYTLSASDRIQFDYYY
tara:strand:+ start:93305 stop:96313 length:3009 start_codon:yes stop_codon:yes gene_type:complete